MQKEKRAATILDHGTILTSADLVKLDIIDWTRYTAYWKNPQQCMERLANALQGMAYTVIEDEIASYPKRDDFPGWSHTGNHEIAGKMFWNYFHYNFKGELHFHDMPDFSGTIFYDEDSYYRKVYGKAKATFFGDVGRVSPITMLDTSQSFFDGTMWVSVAENTSNLVILESPIRAKNSEAQEVREKLTVALEARGLRGIIHYGNVFIEQSGEKIYIGEEQEFFTLSLTQIKTRIKNALLGKWEGTPIPHSSITIPEASIQKSLWD